MNRAEMEWMVFMLLNTEYWSFEWHHFYICQIFIYQSSLSTTNVLIEFFFSENKMLSPSPLSSFSRFFVQNLTEPQRTPNLLRRSLRIKSQQPKQHDDDTGDTNFTPPYQRTLPPFTPFHCRDEVGRFILAPSFKSSSWWYVILKAKRF